MKIPQDKVLHFVFGLVIAQVVALLHIRLGIEHYGLAYLNGLAVGVVCGVAKEVLDSKEVNNRFDKDDLLATSFGAFFGMAVLLIGYGF